MTAPIVLELNAFKASRIVIDGQDIAKYVSSLVVRADSREMPQLELELIGPIEVTVNGAVISTEHINIEGTKENA